VEASCQFYTAGDKLGFSTFDSFTSVSFWLEARGHTKPKRMEMERKTPPLELSRSQIFRFRRRVGSLDERLAAGTKSLRRAAWPACRTRCRGPRCCRSTRAWRALIQPVGSTRPSSNSGVRGTAITSWPRRTCRYSHLGGYWRTRGAAQGRRTPLHACTRFSTAGGCRLAKPGVRGRVAQQPPIRGADGHGPSALRWIASACGLDGIAAGHGPVAGASRTRCRYLHVFGPTMPAV
jgi:hypothetical protein